jgi:hypothetical protein
MNFELKIQAPKTKPVVWNYEELKSDLTTALKDYESRVYTEDTIAEAKEDRAKLNKLKKAINDERIAREKEYMQPFNEFKAQAKELCEMIDTASSGIGEQLEAFEQKRLDEKTSHIQTLFNDVASNYDLPFITLEKVMNDKWLNKATSDKAIVEEITERFEKAIKDLEVIRKMPSYSFEAEESYKTCLDLNTALEEGEKISEIQHKKNTANADGKKYEISFKCKLTVNQAKALKEFCKQNGIVLEQI